MELRGNLILNTDKYPYDIDIYNYQSSFFAVYNKQCIKDMKKMYIISHKQLSSDIKQQLRAHDKFNTIHNNMNTIKLLKAIKLI